MIQARETPDVFDQPVAALEGAAVRKESARGRPPWAERTRDRRACAAAIHAAASAQAIRGALGCLLRVIVATVSRGNTQLGAAALFPLDTRDDVGLA
ncbi:hypothetical protein AB4099_34950 [Bosea sp. 2KB_26]|uniref:hypothetical protein n=1 Tax=Bosea sp. 2KB_26 TaxID=3237475 RepID=UPI003F92F917